MIKAATIAGSDASGGAGLEADLKTFEEYGVYGMAAVTLIATMDPHNNWAHAVFPLEEKVLRAQLETIFAGIGPDAVKTGMLGSSYAIELAREYISAHKNRTYVLDPVMVCKGAGEALHPELNRDLEKKLLPLCTVVTPNLFEAAQLAGTDEITTKEQMETAARIIADKGAKNVFIKGGSKLAAASGLSCASDLFYDGTSAEFIESPLIATEWTHGAGCTVAAAVTAGLARSFSVREAVLLAKKFITESLSASFQLNRWVGPGNPSAWRKAF
ncbi:bifunctional hydroxymethylpyrimidine kinase/phosphomethylpyrimidine kinase [Treponema sp. OMZ 840]|uniref:bifunctional hydroxymethylpyrimidine kinase/phosphomethylpyrimidine kinase n=1 Tax=Treponema sp. OMZ 840 TaxID=244313 RepID=UPI003D8E08A8